MDLDRSPQGLNRASSGLQRAIDSRAHFRKSAPLQRIGILVFQWSRVFFKLYSKSFARNGDMAYRAVSFFS